MRTGVTEPRRLLAARLASRRAEIEQATLTRVYAISDPSDVSDSAYIAGLREAVATALGYGLDAIESPDERHLRVPPGLLAQARVAARSGVSLDTVLRRYIAGYTILGDYLVQEGEGLIDGSELKRCLRSQASILDQLLAAVSEEYVREVDSRVDGSEQHRAEQVDRLLASELVDTTEIPYDFEAHHIAIVASDSKAATEIRECATALDRRLLLIPRPGATVRAWLGGRQSIDPNRLIRWLSSPRRTGFAFAIGEPATGLAGWRLTYKQARAALQVGLRSSTPVVRYADVALLAAANEDDLLTASLRSLYLDPLRGVPDALKTLRAYFNSDRNVTSAAAALGVTRRTVGNRLRLIESRLNRPLRTVVTDLELALRLCDLDDSRAN